MPLAGGGSGVGRGVVLACAYSLGLGVPFLLIAAGYSRAGRASAWLRRHHRGIQLRRRHPAARASGCCWSPGVWDDLTAQLQTRLVSGYETVI